MKLRHAALLCIALLAAALPLPFIAAAAGAGARSHNWAGYVAEGGGYSAVSGSWTIPAAAGAAGAGDAAWVGIGGMRGGDLIQAGTRADVSAGGSSYEAWYDLLPAAATPIAMTVAPGDRMRAAIAELAPGRWRIELDDESRGERFSTELAYDSSGSSAEWIEEAPQRAGVDLPLDDFSAIAFSGASATRAGDAKTPAALGAARVSLVDASGALLAAPGRAQGGSFTIARAPAQ